ncbi:unnamed protein product [Staurois parvus]|uniref:Uncharacterized protein n=1 Tax=Staurois parvus TaxID=386267 RepID=A0ABN9ASJ2_9NEOB|nr:unnamed protein product [Staurois parvus]
MDTDRWHCWGYTDHQGTLIISALMITVSVTAQGTSTLIIRALMLSALMVSVAPSVPPVSAHQCHISVPI